MTESPSPTPPDGRTAVRRPSRRRTAPAQPTRAVRRRSTLLIALAIIVPQVVLAAILAATLGMVPHRAALASADNGRRLMHTSLGVGDCVRPDGGRGPYYVAAPCSDDRVVGRVIAVVPGPVPGTEACAAEADFFATRPGQVICLRRSGDTHPGDPGQGGGVYRAGDCVATDASTGVIEVPCNAPTVFETVTGRVRSSAECAAPAVRFASLKHGEQQILCLGDGPGLASPGECIGDPERPPVTFDVIPCDDPAARAQVLARVADVSACRAVPKQTHYVKDPSGLPGSAVVCIQKLR